MDMDLGFACGRAHSSMTDIIGLTFMVAPLATALVESHRPTGRPTTTEPG